jgi:single-stranded-DNA-specific exonuclease
MHKQWKVKNNPPEEFMRQFPELTRILCRLLYSRGLSEKEAIEIFLDPRFETGVHDPFLFRDMQKAVERIFSARKHREKIILYGDYDADGITAVVIGASVFKSLGFKEGEAFDVYLPDRDREGYGLNSNTLRLLAEKGAKLIITADCGITNISEVDVANSLGVDVIITDHHSIPEVLPKAFAVLNPRLPDETYPCKFLCGAGTLFKLMQGLLKEASKYPEYAGIAMESVMKWLFDIAAIGTVADMVPLLDENRLMVKYGLVVLNKTQRIGLRKLVDIAFHAKNGNASKPRRALDAYSIGFQIAPRINAAGRIEHSSQSYRLLMSEAEDEAENLSKSLNVTNTHRQQLTEEIFSEGKRQIANMDPKAKIYCVLGEEWSSGVVGLVAGKLTSEYYRPVIVATRMLGSIRGSGRSVRELDLIATLRELDSRFFDKLGGHPMACGFTLADGVNFDDFRTALTALVNEKLAEVELIPTLDIDTEISLFDVNWELYEDLAKMQPFGMANPQPVFLISNCEVVELFPVGSDAKHLRLRVRQKSSEGSYVERNVIGFSMGARCDECQIGDTLDLVASLELNEWNGNRELQLKLSDMRKSNEF